MNAVTRQTYPSFSDAWEFANTLVKQDQTLLITGLLHPSSLNKIPLVESYSRVQFTTDWKSEEAARPFLNKLKQIGQVQWIPPKLGKGERTEVTLNIHIDDLREAIDFMHKQLGPVLKTKKA